MARRVLIFTLATLAVLTAAGVAGWRLNLRERSRYTDAASINAPLSTAPVRQILWQPASPLPDAADASADQYEPRISPDGQLMIFVRGRAGTNADLFQSRRTPEGWSAPEPVKVINSQSDELGPELAPDGRTLYFYSDRTGTIGGFDLWLSRRDESGEEWTEPVNLGPAVNTEFNEYGPALSPDNRRLYFSSNRPRPGENRRQRNPWPATIREDRARHDYDLYCYDFDGTDRAAGSIDASNRVDAAAPLLVLNTPHDEGAPALSPAGDFLYFASDRPGTTGGFDIFRSRIVRGHIQPPENLGPNINSVSNDLDPSLSTDGFRIYFSSDRPTSREAERASAPTQSPAADEPARYALFSSASREVFIETDPLHAAALLARLWAATWPWLLALLAALILATLFYFAMRDAAIRHRLAQLSLMAKCLLISLLIHAALLSAFAAWRVGTAIGDALRDAGQGDGTRVTLGASAGSGSLESQVRGSLTTLSIEAPTIEASRPETTTLNIVAPAIQVATAPANLSFTLSPMAFRPEVSAETRASPSPQPITPPLGDAAPATRTPTPDPAPAQAAESRAELNLDPSALPTRAALITSASTAPGPLSINPAPATIAVPHSGNAAHPTRDSISTLIASTPSATSSPALPPSSGPDGISSRLPQAPSGAATAAEPATPSGSAIAASLPSSTHPALPGATGAPHIAIPLPLTSIAGTPSAPSAAVKPNDAPATASAPAAISQLPSPPSTSNPALAARLPGDALARSASSEASRDSLGSTAPTLGDAAPSRPTLAIGTSSRSTSVHLAPGAAGSRAPSPSPSAHIPPSESPAGLSASATPASPGADLPRLPAIALKSGIPAIPADAPQNAAPAPPENFAQRSPELREEVLKKTGGSVESERAVAAALDWFSRHQATDGRWSGRHFDLACRHCSAPAEIDADAAMTGITLLCFLGAGHTHLADGPHRASVRNALTWIVNRTDASGDLRGGGAGGRRGASRGETMYSQTIAAIALCEAFAMTRDPWLEAPARRAITFVARGAARNGSTDSSDTSVLGWQIMAIKSAQRAGFDVPTAAFDAARRWLDQTAARNAPGRYGYAPGDSPSPAATAEAMFVQQLLGRTRDEPRMRQSAEFILTAPPAWRREAPTHYWYYATLALFQQQGAHWTAWNEGIARELIRNQRQEEGLRGSWDPQDPWSRLGGRVYQTAVCTLSLEVYYRYRLAEPANAP